MNGQNMSFRAMIASLRDRYNYVFTGLLLLKALGAWLYAMAKFPHVPLSVLAIYRNAGNDMTYLPIIAGLSKAGLHEPFVREFAGTGIMQFPIFSALPLTILLKLFGPVGFILADIVFLFATFWVLSLLFRLLGVTSIIARCLSLLVVTNVLYLLGHIRFWLVSRIEPKLLHVPVPENPGYFLQTPWLQNGIPLLCIAAMIVVLGLFLRGDAARRSQMLSLGLAIYLAALVLISSYFFVIWGWRLPRPLDTGVFYFAGLASLTWLAREPRRTSPAPWLVFGACWAVLVQSYIYEAFLLGISAVCVLAWLTATRALQARILLRNLALCTGLAALLCLPIAYQQLHGRPDLFQRYGGYVLPHFSFPYFLPESPESVEIVLAALFAILILRLGGPNSADRRRGSTLLTGLLVASLLSLPISVLVLGRSIQVGHFSEEYYQALSMGLAVLLAYGLDLWRGEPGDRKRHRRISAAIMAICCLAATAAIAIESRRPSAMTTAVRNDFVEYAGFANYRRDFNALAGELSKPSYHGLALASFDVQVQSWWTTFDHGNVYLPDVFSTTMADAEIETRLILLCKAIGMNENQFMSLITDPFAQIFFLSHAKYMGSALHSYAPLPDYSAADQAEIHANSIFSTFKLYLPLAEQARLRTKFRDTVSTFDHRDRDLLLLTNGKTLGRFGPGPGYTLAYHNDTFRLWRRSGP
jgi:hypothetical protein